MTKNDIREIVREEIKEALEKLASACLHRYSVIPSGEVADAVWEVGRALENGIADAGY